MSDRPAAIERGTALLWAAAAAVAALGTWIAFDASPGINWFLWTAAASSGLLIFTSSRISPTSPIMTMAAIATIIAGGAFISAGEFIFVLVVLSVIVYLAMAMLLSSDQRWKRITAGFIVSAPIVAFGHALVEAVRRAVDSLHLVRSHRARSVLRGIAITLPVVIIFGLLLSSADPMFAGWRNALDRLLSSWDFLPRTIFFCGLLVLTLGAYGFAANGEPASDIAEPPRSRGWLGATERIILLAGVSALLWLFLAVQLTYLFGNLPEVQGSGVTFADYARRGFGELTVVASASALLILFSERFGQETERATLLRAVTISLIVAVLFLLGSAFRRVSLYEEAYGFTTARLYAQTYMLIISVVLLLLALESRGIIDTARLSRRSGAAATIALIGLIYWNHEAWIAKQNIERVTGRPLDVAYLTRDLSMNAIPTLASRLPSMPEPARTQLRAAIESRYRGRQNLFQSRWYEWNLARQRARKSLDQLGVQLVLPDTTVRR